jgi:hypothetical protein
MNEIEHFATLDPSSKGDDSTLFQTLELPQRTFLTSNATNLL